MTKSMGVGRGGKRPGTGSKPGEVRRKPKVAKPTAPPNHQTVHQWGAAHQTDAAEQTIDELVVAQLRKLATSARSEKVRLQALERLDDRLRRSTPPAPGKKEAAAIAAATPDETTEFGRLLAARRAMQ